MVSRNRWLAMVLAVVLLAGLATALQINLRSPQPAPVPPIELETDDRGRLRPTGPEEAPYDDSGESDDDPDGLDDDSDERVDDDLGGDDDADDGDDGGDTDD
jgi:hypothetical protein